MQITRTPLRRPLQKPATVQAPPQEASTFSEDSSLVDTLKTAAGLMVPVSALAGGGAAAYYASPLFHLGDGMPALYGSLAGGIVGGAAGLAIGLGGAKLYTKYSGDDQAGKGMMSGFMALGGAAAGAVVGAVGGAFGANPLVTVPAAIAGATIPLAATSYVASKVLD